jgi:hypothetical protein
MLIILEEDRIHCVGAYYFVSNYLKIIFAGDVVFECFPPADWSQS